jgi:chemotaxis response regulator CheB
MPLLARIATVAVQVGEAADQRGAEQRLELIEHRAVDQPRNHFAHVERLLGIGRHHAVQLVGGVQRRHRCQALQLRPACAS